ncbi:hypothetical protein M2135_001030 [Parabacteroides sp. PF5-9]|nr:hypothetical protein [Parabacteroides sp. PF5-9]
MEGWPDKCFGDSQNIESYWMIFMRLLNIIAVFFVYFMHVCIFVD